MASYVASRLLIAIPTLLGVTVVVFLLIHSGGDPVSLLLPPEATEEQRAALERFYGLDKPLAEQYGVFLSNAVRGDFGPSFRYGAPAMQIVLQRFPATVQLAAAGALIALAIGIPAGIVAARNRGSILDNLVMLGSVLGQSMPTFWLGLLLMMVFALMLGWLPSSGTGEGMASLTYLILPAVTLSPWLTTITARLTRSGMLEVLSQEYIRTAHAKGLAPRVILIRHALRNALIPVISMAGMVLAWNLGNAVVVEIIFAWPGVGSLAYDSIVRRDYNVVVTIVTLVATAFVVINLAVDILSAYIDPRIKLEGE